MRPLFASQEDDNDALNDKTVAVSLWKGSDHCCNKGGFPTNKLVRGVFLCVSATRTRWAQSDRAGVPNDRSVV
jgi:hypothetical protein